MMERDEFISKYASRLSGQQLAAVTDEGKKLLLLAVPASGKTTVLVTRLGYLLSVCGVRPEGVLTLTYTISATKDMRVRYEAIFGEGSSGGIEFWTINGICAKIIQGYAEAIGRPAFSLVTDERDTVRILTEALAQNLSDYPTESDVKAARTLITYCKNMMLGAEEIEALGRREGFPLTGIPEEERRLFYVGMTRAVNDLTILCCGGERSSFLSELRPVESMKKGESAKSGSYKREPTKNIVR